MPRPFGPGHLGSSSGCGATGTDTNTTTNTTTTTTTTTNTTTDIAILSLPEPLLLPGLLLLVRCATSDAAVMPMSVFIGVRRIPLQLTRAPRFGHFGP